MSNSPFIINQRVSNLQSSIAANIRGGGGYPSLSNPLEENYPEYIETAIAGGYDVEIDVRCEDHQFYLGHDEQQYYVPMTWLVKRKDKLWIHCKDFKSLDIFSNNPIDFNFFGMKTIIIL